MPIGVVFLIVLLNMTAYRGSKVVVTLFAIELGAPQLYIGVLVAMYAVFPMLLGLYAGKLTDRLGVRLPMIAGSLGVAAGLLIPFFFPRIPALYMSAIFIGASWVFYNVCVQNLIGMLSEVDARPQFQQLWPRHGRRQLLRAGARRLFDRAFRSRANVPISRARAVRSALILFSFRSMPTSGGRRQRVKSTQPSPRAC